MGCASHCIREPAYVKWVIDRSLELMVKCVYIMSQFDLNILKRIFLIFLPIKNFKVRQNSKETGNLLQI